MITTNTDGQALSAAFVAAVAEPMVEYDLKLAISGAEVACTVKDAKLSLGAGAVGDLATQDFATGDVLTTQFDANLYDAPTLMGETMEVRVGVDVGGSYEYVAVATVTVSTERVWNGISTISAVGAAGAAMAAPAGLSDGYMAPSALASAISSASGVTVTLGAFPSMFVQVATSASMNCRDALAALALNLGGFAAENPDGTVAVSPFSAQPTYTLPSEFVVQAPEVQPMDYDCDGIEVSDGGSTWTKGTGRLKMQVDGATSETADAIWANVGGYGFRPGKIHTALVDPRVTCFDVVSLTTGGSTYVVPARGIEAKFDGGYFGSYSAAGLTEVQEAALREGPIERRAANAETAAEEAKAVAEAVNQHFWHDANGAHVTDEDQDDYVEAQAAGFPDWQPDPESPGYRPWLASVINSLGHLMTTGSRYIAAFTHSAVAFYDGVGNAASNIVARFGVGGAVIGKEDSDHVAITDTEISFHHVTSSGGATFDNVLARIGGGVTDYGTSGMDARFVTADGVGSLIAASDRLILGKNATSSESRAPVLSKANNRLTFGYGFFTPGDTAWGYISIPSGAYVDCTTGHVTAPVFEGSIEGAYATFTGDITGGNDLCFGGGAAATTYAINAKTTNRNKPIIFAGGGRNTDGGADGTVVGLGAGGLTLVGGGEYASSRYSVGDLADTSERLYLGADAAVYIESNGGTIADRHTMEYNTNGALVVGGASGSTIVKELEGVDLSLADNGVTANQFPGFLTRDAEGRVMARFESRIYTNGDHGFNLYARNYDSSGAVVKTGRLSCMITKAGTASWTVTDPDNFRDAIGALGAAGGTVTGELVSTATGRNAFTSRHETMDTSLADNGLTANSSKYIRFVDKDDRFYAWMTGYATTAGTTKITISTRNLVNGANLDNVLSLSVTKAAKRLVSVSDAPAWRSGIDAAGSIRSTANATSYEFTVDAYNYAADSSQYRIFLVVTQYGASVLRVQGSTDSCSVVDLTTKNAPTATYDHATQKLTLTFASTVYGGVRLVTLD